MVAEPALVASGTSIDGATPVGEVCGVLVGRPWACRDVAVYKYSPSGDLTYVSYLRGTADEAPSAIAVDDTDAVYVTGQTNSPDFGVTPAASQRVYAGPPAPFSQYGDPLRGDVFVAKLDSSGKLVYSTYLGGFDPDSATTIHLDSSGNAYVGGPSSSGLPVTPGAFKSTPYTGPLPHVVNTVGYIAKVGPAGRIAFLTYLPSVPLTFAVDAQGNTYFGGSARGDLPVTPGAYQTQPSGDKQAFLAKLNPSGSSLSYATYYSALGATGVDSIAVDSRGNAWLSGSVPSVSVTSGTDGSYRPFLAKISADGSKALYQTPFIGEQLAVDSSDNLSVLTGPGLGRRAVVRTPGGFVTSVCAAVTISKLDPNGAVLLNRPVEYSPSAVYLSLTRDGDLLAYDRTAGLDIIPIAPAPAPDSSCMLNAGSLSIPNTVAPGEIVTILGRGLGPTKGISFTLDEQGRVPNSAGGVQVLFDGVPAPVLYADDGQVNAIAPFSLNPGSKVAIEVQYQGGMTPPISVTVVDTAMALFSRDASGSGQVLAVNQDGTLNSPANPAKLGSIVTVFVTGAGITAPASVEGAVAASIDARPVTAPFVALAGAPGGAEILYAGPSPGSLTSITQINLRLPASVPPVPSPFPLSQWPILVRNGEQFTQTLTIALSP